MALSASCCLNRPPPPPSSGSNPSSPHLSSSNSQVSWARKEKSWRKQCVVGVTCMIMSLEIWNSMSWQEKAIAQDFQLGGGGGGKEVVRWSDKRTCPPWQLNSLETIVPENLPRPSARRRWERVGHPTTAPTFKFIIRGHTKSDCFSM